MDTRSNFESAMPAPEGGEERIREDCKEMADHFEASSTALFEDQEGLIFHLEFDSPEKFERFAEYLKGRGLLSADAVPTKSDEVC